MSIILKGIDMPKEGELRLIISKNGMICGAEYPKVRHTYPLNLDAEAIQIPKDHGRIIDENEAIRGWCEGCAFKDTEECADCKDKEMCKYAPTILESEE